MEYVHDFFLTDTESHVSFGLSFGILILDTDFKTLLVKVRGSLIIVKIFELLCNTGILLEASIDVLTPVVIFSIDKIATEFEKTFLSLLELLFLDSAKFVIILLRDVGLNLAGSCV